MQEEQNEKPYLTLDKVLAAMEAELDLPTVQDYCTLSDAFTELAGHFELSNMDIRNHRNTMEENKVPNAMVLVDWIKKNTEVKHNKTS